MLSSWAQEESDNEINIGLLILWRIHGEAV